MDIFDIICLNRCLLFGLGLLWPIKRFIMLLNLLLSGLYIDIFLNNLRYLRHNYWETRTKFNIYFCVQDLYDKLFATLFQFSSKMLNGLNGDPMDHCLNSWPIAIASQQTRNIYWWYAVCAWCLRLTNIIIFCWYFLIGFSCRLQAPKPESSIFIIFKMKTQKNRIN